MRVIPCFSLSMPVSCGGFVLRAKISVAHLHAHSSQRELLLSSEKRKQARAFYDLLRKPDAILDSALILLSRETVSHPQLASVCPCAINSRRHDELDEIYRCSYPTASLVSSAQAQIPQIPLFARIHNREATRHGSSLAKIAARHPLLLGCRLLSEIGGFSGGELEPCTRRSTKRSGLTS